MISIVIPTFNAAPYIGDTLRSLLSQQLHAPLELIIVDGQSTDDTLQICQCFREEVASTSCMSPKRDISISIYSEPDTGMYDALAKGLRLVQGDIVGYLNASDILLPGALIAVEQAFSKHPHIRWVTGWNSFMDVDGVITSSKLPFGYPRQLIQSYFYGQYNNHIQQESTFWSRSLLADIDFSRLKSYRYAGDFYLWHCFSENHTLWTLNALVGCFRKHPGQLSSALEGYHAEALRITGGETSGILIAGIYRMLNHFPNFIKTRIHPTLIRR
ncbi:hypothetical protein A9179_20165 [Pseudomonas alcaligenes]|uniref:Glycosyltransferase 2-like domain-containing protein n=1 Tax=Aquipseudomonas alcaligenes TaxID=43263 RepID=A0ABR7S7J8_AQUAC|nr:glycosyltransferase [Pseudomonas alcaligenes]MBC9252586.1 hypothetical protein [Pseudomonas alcaligenes]